MHLCGVVEGESGVGAQGDENVVGVDRDLARLVEGNTTAWVGWWSHDWWWGNTVSAVRRSPSACIPAFDLASGSASVSTHRVPVIALLRVNDDAVTTLGDALPFGVSFIAILQAAGAYSNSSTSFARKVTVHAPSVGVEEFTCSAFDGFEDELVTDIVVVSVEAIGTNTTSHLGIVDSVLGAACALSFVDELV